MSQKRVLVQDPSYRERVVASRFPDYKIKWTDPHRAILKPKEQPTKLQATLFPMYEIRFKYEIVFDPKTCQVTHDDLLKITFNRSNGATLEQQERIFEHREQFEEKVKQLQAQIEFDQEEADKKAEAPSQAA